MAKPQTLASMVLEFTKELHAEMSCTQDNFNVEINTMQDVNGNLQADDIDTMRDDLQADIVTMRDKL